MSVPLWTPPVKNFAESQMAHFLDFVNETYQQHYADYPSLYHWSITHPDQFWNAIWHFCQIIASKPPQKAMVEDPQHRMWKTAWFPAAKLNFAENLLQYQDDKVALLYVDERGNRQSLSYAQLYQQVAATAHYLRQLGVKKGDRVVGVLPNSPVTVIAMLATASIGGIWSACSPDFGLEGLVDRFGQIEPKVLFFADAHYYNGKSFSHLEQLPLLQKKLTSLQTTIIVCTTENKMDVTSFLDSVLIEKYCQEATPHLYFEPVPFNQPLYILYSSGTTGKPKCMVHGVGGTLIQHLKELKLHIDLKREDTIFFYTTCTWMMWHWLISSLAVGATVVLYEGSPFYRGSTALFDLIDECNISVFGVSAKFLETAEKSGLIPLQSHALTELRSILTTGSPLLPESFDYVYQKVKPSVCLSSISGGSDIISCFALGNPLLPVYRGELQCIGLGMNVRIFNETGQSIQQKKGELVCTAPFPSMPLYFWNDPDEQKYQQAYFSHFPNVWTHGDYAEITHHGGLIIYGRSDATLNPGGVRIGTAEIYHQVEKFPKILDCVAVAQQWEGSERIILFVILREKETLSHELIQQIKNTIRQNTSPHHVPAKIIAAPDFPRTHNGKLMELTIKKMIHHEPIQNMESLANPESLAFFANIPELSQ